MPEELWDDDSAIVPTLKEFSLWRNISTEWFRKWGDGCLLQRWEKHWRISRKAMKAQLRAFMNWRAVFYHGNSILREAIPYGGCQFFVLSSLGSIAEAIWDRDGTTLWLRLLFLAEGFSLQLRMVKDTSISCQVTQKCSKCPFWLPL